MKAALVLDTDNLNGDQWRGWACALCGARLYADRPLCKARDRSGELVQLWACAPACPSKPRGPSVPPQRY
ncbi:hypothetical protein [Streptomyces sp. NPDC058466]|uniref:hypothetical protein n=1 Tax=Streptomyces sp. NPDC058466 TaxID=3346512 RepID=UPI003665C607